MNFGSVPLAQAAATALRSPATGRRARLLLEGHTDSVSILHGGAHRLGPRQGGVCEPKHHRRLRRGTGELPGLDP